jgi:hypothetical protein
MRVNKGRIYFILIAAGVYFAWHYLPRTANETVVLHIPPATRSQDTYVNLWVVEDAQSVWIRAESRERLWLEYLRDGPMVELQRYDGTRQYRAVPDDSERTRTKIDSMFREKYRIADILRAPIRGQTVPIRLVRR